MEEKLFVEINKVDIPDGMEMLDFGGAIMNMLSMAKAKLKKSLSLIGIYNNYIITKDRESGRLFKLSLSTKDGEIDLGKPVEVKQSFSEVTKAAAKKIAVETGETNGHVHTANIDESGTGVTNKVEGHAHEISGGKVAAAEGHTHSLTMPEAEGGEEKDKKKTQKADDSPEYIELTVQKSAGLWSGIIR